MTSTDFPGQLTRPELTGGNPYDQRIADRAELIRLQRIALAEIDPTLGAALHPAITGDIVRDIIKAGDDDGQVAA